MTDAHVDAQYYALIIRRLAGRYQAGEEFSEIKARIDSVINVLDNLFSACADHQSDRWHEIYEELKGFCITSDPKWNDALCYARRKINNRKKSAVYRAGKEGH